MTAQRTIPFGTGRHLGTLYHRELSTTWGGWSEWWPFDGNEEVYGPVSVPADSQVRLWASQKKDGRRERVPARFDGLCDLAPDDLDSLAVLTPAPGWATDIAHLTGLSELIAEGWDELSEDEFRRLLGLQQLIGLHVGYSEIRPDRLARLIDANPKLRCFGAIASNVGDDSAPVIARRPLRWLDLGSTRITDAGLRRLGGLTDLQLLDLNGCAVGDDGMGALAGMELLQRLELDGTTVTDAGLAPVVGEMCRLEYLSLSKTGVGDGTIASLACPSLEVLFLSDTNVTGATLDPALLGRLSHLGLSSAPLTEEGVAQIGRLPALQSLSLIGVSIDDATLAKLNGHPTLERIHLAHTPVSPRAILGLIESLPHLKRLGRGMRDYTNPEAISEYAAKLRTAPAGAKTIRFEDLDPVAGEADSLQGTWRDLGRIVDEEWSFPRVFAHDRFGRLWVGCRDEVGSWRDPKPEVWQQPGWWPTGTGPIALGNVGGALVFGPDLRAWIGSRDLWSYNMLGRTKLRRERPATWGHCVDVGFDRSGRPWAIRSSDEVWRETRRGWRQVPIPELPKNTAMHSIVGHPDGSMWIGCGRGLLRWHRGTWTQWEGPSDGLPDSYWVDVWEPSKETSMETVVVGSDGAVWAAGGTGVVRLRDGELTCWDHRDGLWPCRQLAVDATTGDVYGAGSRHIGRFDGAEWAMAELPTLDGRVHGWGIHHIAVHDGRLLVLTADAHLREFTPNDLAERQAAAPSGRRTVGQRLRSLRRV